MLKNNAGYDLKHLFIGSEGTLEHRHTVVLRHPMPESCETALCTAADYQMVLVRFLNHAKSASVERFQHLRSCGQTFTSLSLTVC